MCEVRWPRTRRRVQTKLPRQLSQLRLRLGQQFVHREQPRHDALDIAVHRNRRHTKGNRTNRSGGVVANTRQRTEPRQIAWEATGGRSVRQEDRGA